MTEISTAPPVSGPEAGSPLPGWYADPNLVAFDGRYYVYPTTDGHEDWASASFSVLSSADLADWTDHGEILRLGDDVSWAREGAWAPAIATRNGKFYLYFTADQNIGVAIGDTPLGPFRDLGRPLIRSEDFPGHMIDPSVFTDEDGTVYFYWGNGRAYGVPLNEDMVSFDPERVVAWQPTGFREAAWVHRRGGIYYLSWSENDTREEDYRVRYATGPGPLGPWTDRGVLLEKDISRGIKGTGHHSILCVPGTDDWIIAYHRFAIPNGDGFHRETMLDRLVHSTGGLIQKVVPARSPIRLPIHHQLNTFNEK